MINIDDGFWTKVKQGWSNHCEESTEDKINNNVKSVLGSRKNRGNRIKKEIDFIMDMEEI